jgi:hypothetical protein
MRTAGRRGTNRMKERPMSHRFAPLVILVLALALGGCAKMGPTPDGVFEILDFLFSMAETEGGTTGAGSGGPDPGGMAGGGAGPGG